eukprot:jgi/Tetstr1/435448/TSEL_024354.t1
MILVQSYNATPLNIRKNLSHFSVFKPRNKKETERIFEELIVLNKHESLDVLRFIYRDSYDFMFGITMTGQLHRNFNELHLKGSDDMVDEGSDSEGSESDTSSDGGQGD